MRWRLMALLLVGTQGVASPAPDLSGATSWVRAQSGAEVEAIKAAAVDKAVKQFSWAIRPFARPQLEGTTGTCSSYRIHHDADFHWQCDSHPPNRRTPGTQTPFSDGEAGEFTLIMSRSGDSWTADYSKGDSGKRVTWTFVNASRLAVTQEVYSPQLTTPMRWTVLFKPGP